MVFDKNIFRADFEVKFSQGMPKKIFEMTEINMAFKINDNCISCGICAADCPVSCINSGGEKYVISADECVDCGACASVCPANAIETA